MIGAESSEQFYNVVDIESLADIHILVKERFLIIAINSLEMVYFL